jgi:hypothetical protein
MDEQSFIEQSTSDDVCFLCGASGQDVTLEHVFPKWLQRRFNLWTQRVGLLNDSLIQYRQLTIPACARCNNVDLSRLESAVAKAVDGGYATASSLDPYLWYLWAGKLFYGVLRRELNLFRNRAKPEEGSIVSDSLLKSFSNLYLFLQGIRKKHEFTSEPPYSVLVCNLHDLGHLRNYGFRDNMIHMTVSVRMGDIALLVSLEDGGLTTESYGRFVGEVAGRKLHPIQFDELTAKVAYQVALLNGGVTYISSKVIDASEPMKTFVHRGGYLHEWSQEEFSHVLRAHVAGWLSEKEANETQWFVPPNSVPTWMTRPDGQLRLVALETWERN